MHFYHGDMDLTAFDYKIILYSPLFSKSIIALIIFFVGITIGRIAGKIVNRVLSELEIDATVKKTTRIKLSIEKSISNFITYFIYFVTIIISLSELGVSTTALNLITASMLLIIVIILFFILNYFFPNIIAGIFIKRKNIIHENDYIKFGDKEGKIVKINLIETLIKTKKGDTIYIPNSILAKREIVKLRR